MALFRLCTLRSNLPKLRQFCSTKTSEIEFKTIYHFPYIKLASVISRLKVHQSVLSAVAIPSSTILYNSNVITEDAVVFTSILSLGGLIPLYALGYFTHRLIGFVYFCEDRDLVKIAYLDFWGRREERILAVNEIRPFSDRPKSVLDPLYLKVEELSSKKCMKMCDRYGILDYSTFNKIFS